MRELLKTFFLKCDIPMGSIDTCTDMFLYPMLGVDFHFWLVNNREVYTCISRLTSSAWNIMRKERHWWCHNCNQDHHLLSLPLWCDRATLCSYDDLGKIKGVSEILKLRKCFRTWQTSFDHGIKHLVCFRRYGNISRLSIAIPCLAFGPACGIAAMCVDKFPHQQTRGN